MARARIALLLLVLALLGACGYGWYEVGVGVGGPIGYDPWEDPFYDPGYDVYAADAPLPVPE